MGSSKGLIDILNDMAQADYLAEQIARKTGMANDGLYLNYKMKPGKYAHRKTGFWGELFNTKAYREAVEYNRMMDLCKQADDDYTDTWQRAGLYERTPEIVDHIERLRIITKMEDLNAKAEAYEYILKTYGTFIAHTIS